MLLHIILLAFAILTVVATHYDTLGIPRTANDARIKSAYRDLAKKYHPDKNKDDDAQAMFVKISNAYELLSDSTKRQEYDNDLKYGNAHDSNLNRRRTSNYQDGGFPFDEMVFRHHQQQQQQQRYHNREENVFFFHNGRRVYLKTQNGGGSSYSFQFNSFHSHDQQHTVTWYTILQVLLQLIHYFPFPTLVFTIFFYYCCCSGGTRSTNRTAPKDVGCHKSNIISGSSLRYVNKQILSSANKIVVVVDEALENDVRSIERKFHDMTFVKSVAFKHKSYNIMVTCKQGSRYCTCTVNPNDSDKLVRVMESVVNGEVAWNVYKDTDSRDLQDGAASSPDYDDLCSRNTTT